MSQHLLTTPTMLAASTLVAWSALEANGHDAKEIFLQAGLDPAKLKDQDARYSAQSVTRLHEVVIEVTGDPCFMLKLADFWHPSQLHALGYGWLASSSLRDAFHRLTRYYDISAVSAERISLEKKDGNYLFEVTVPEGVPWHETEEDSLMVVLVTMCRLSYGASFNPLQVRLRRSEPPCADDFHGYFGTTVEFSASELSMLLPCREIEVELPTANTTMARACDHIIDDYLARLDRAHVINRVRMKLIEAMPSGTVSEDRVAQSLHMSVRSLQRRLKQEGTTFKSVLYATRMELARSYIREKHTLINEITYLLGYSDSANFSRAYKRWSGMTPSQERSRGV